MNTRTVLFTTEHCNLSKVGEDFINRCGFGEDLARWLQVKLIEANSDTREPAAEDWGWELPVRTQGRS